MQSSLIHCLTAKFQFHSHVIMTPNVYGGHDHPFSLMGTMRSAIQSRQSFTVQTPATLKRFVHITSFSSYVAALLQELIRRDNQSPAQARFTVSSMDFVPATSVGTFALQQWLLMGGSASELKGLQTD